MSKSLKGRRLFFATRGDLVPGLRAAERAIAVQYVLAEMRDDDAFTVIDALSDNAGLGQAVTDVVISEPRYLIFHRGEAPAPRRVPQKRGGDKYLVESSPDCLILRVGGLQATSGALLAGELQEPLDPSGRAIEMFRVFSRELFRGFERVKLYWVGPEALSALHAGKRLVTIGINSPREYDLAL